MDSSAEKAKLGIFMAVTIAVGVAVLLLLVGINLDRREDEYIVRYEQSVTGLQPGSTVTLNGVPVGQVRMMEVNPENVEEITVTLGIKADTPVKVDTKAFMLSQGITGLKYIDLQGSTKEAARLEEGSEIPAGVGLIDRLTDRADDLSATADDITRNLAYITREENRKRIDEILIQSNELVSNVNQLTIEVTKTLIVVRELVERNEESIDATIKNVGSASVEFRGVLREGRLTLQTGRQTIENAKIDELVRGFSDTNLMLQGKVSAIDTDALTAAISTLQQLLVEVIGTVSANQEQLRAMLFNMRQTTENLKALSRELRDQPSKLVFDKQPEERPLPR